MWITNTCSCVYLHAHAGAYTHRAIDNDPVYRPVILLRYGLASGCCLVTVISLVVVTALVAICRAVAQLLCPGFRSPLCLCVATRAHLRFSGCKFVFNTVNDVFCCLLLSAVLLYKLWRSIVQNFSETPHVSWTSLNKNRSILPMYDKHLFNWWLKLNCWCNLDRRSPAFFFLVWLFQSVLLSYRCQAPKRSRRRCIEIERSSPLLNFYMKPAKAAGANRGFVLQ